MRSGMVRLIATFVLGVAVSFLSGCEQQPVRSTDVQVVAFTAAWCGPCRADKPRLAQIERYVTVIRVDTDHDLSGAAKQFRVGELPTYIVLTPDGERFRTGNIEELAKVLGIQ